MKTITANGPGKQHTKFGQGTVHGMHSHSLRSRRERNPIFPLNRNRCNNCIGCSQTTDCSKCKFCMDKPKFGGLDPKAVVPEKKMPKVGTNSGSNNNSSCS